MLFRSLLFALIGLVSIAWSMPACQNENDTKIKVTVVVILAGEDAGPVDKSLKWIAAEVQKKNPNLKSFKLKSMTSKSLAENEKASFPLVEDKAAQIVIQHGANKDNRVSLAVTAPTLGQIEYETSCGKFLPIVTRYQTAAKERVILAIRVQPCQEN